MARLPQLTVDPAGDAASLLRRVGFLILMLGLPLGALASRTSPVFVFTVGVAVVAAASVFAGTNASLRDSMARLGSSTAFAAGALVAGWALLSLAWTPDIRLAGSAASSLLGVAAVGALGYLALPDRMRAANLYPMPVAVALAAFVSIGLLLGGTGEPQRDLVVRMDRGLAILVFYAWPAIAWLRSRSRDIEAGALAIMAAGAAALGPNPVPVVAFAIGALTYFVVQAAGRRGAIAIGILIGALILLVPVLLAASPAVASDARWWTDIGPWRTALLSEPVQILTGHGLGSLRSTRLAAGLPPIFGASLIGLWYELGLVGAAGIAVAVWAALLGAATKLGPLLPGLAAAVSTATILDLSGIDGGALWWPVALATVGLMFIAAERGQFRTRRPRAITFGRSRTS